MTDRIKRLESLFLTEIAGFISRYHTDKFKGIITISAVKLTKNLQSARVYYSVMGGKQDAEDILLAIKREITHYLAKRLKIRRIPALTFEFDKTAQKAANLETVFKKINEQKAQNEKN